MLTQTLGDLLPAAVGVALSPVPIIAVILMLGTPKARSNGPAFAAGWVTGLSVVSVIVLLVAGGADDPDSATATGVDWAQVAIGVLFLAMAARQWRNRPQQGEEPEMPKWMATIDTFTPGRSLVFGVLLSGVNPKNLALTAAGATTIAQAGLSSGESAIAVGVFVIIASLTVAGPVVLFLAAPDRSKETLTTVKEFLSTHNAVIVMVVLLVLGAKILGQGLGAVGS